MAGVGLRTQQLANPGFETALAGPPIVWNVALGTTTRDTSVYNTLSEDGDVINGGASLRWDPSTTIGSRYQRLTDAITGANALSAGYKMHVRYYAKAVNLNYVLKAKGCQVYFSLVPSNSYFHPYSHNRTMPRNGTGQYSLPQLTTTDKNNDPSWIKVDYVTDRVPADTTSCFVYAIWDVMTAGEVTASAGGAGYIDDILVETLEGIDFFPNWKIPQYRGKLWLPDNDRIVVASFLQADTTAGDTRNASELEVVLELKQSTFLRASSTFDAGTSGIVNDYAMDVSALAPGSYDCVVKARLKSNGTIVTQDTLHHQLWIDDPASPGTSPTITITDDYKFKRGTVEDFPVFIYTYEYYALGKSHWDATFADIAASDFNGVINYASLETPSQVTEILDSAHAAGVKVLWSLSNRLVIPGEVQPYNAITAIVDANKNHPALLGWYINDENNGWWADIQVKELRDYITVNAPNNPLFQVWAAGYSPYAPRALPWADVIAEDSYPIYNSQAISQVTTNFNTIKNQAAGQCMWGVPEICVFTATAVPTEEQMYCIAYQMVIAGAKGLMFYRYDQGKARADGAAWWESVKRVATRLKAIGNIAFAEDAPANKELTSSNTNVKTLTKVVGNDTVTLVTNASSTSQTTTITIGIGNLSLLTFNTRIKYLTDVYSGLNVVEVNSVTGDQIPVTLSSPYFSVTLDPAATKEYRILYPDSEENYGIYAKFAGVYDYTNVLNDTIIDADNTNPLSPPEENSYEFVPMDLGTNLNTEDDFLSFYNPILNVASYRSATYTDYFFHIYSKYDNMDARFGMTHPTYSNFNLNAVPINNTFNKSLINISLDYTGSATQVYDEIFSSIPDVQVSTITGKIETFAHVYAIHVLNAGQDFVDNAVYDLSHKSLEFRSYTATVATTIPYYCTQISTNIPFMETVAYSSEVSVNDVGYILGGLTPITINSPAGYYTFAAKSDFSGKHTKVTENVIDVDKYSLVATQLVDFPGAPRFGSAIFAIGDNIYYGLGVIATWMNALHLDPEKLPEDWIYNKDTEYLYAFPVEHVCGASSRNEIYAFAGPKHINKYLFNTSLSTGTWINMLPTHNYPIASSKYTHVKNSVIEHYPSKYVLKTNYDDVSKAINFVKFKRKDLITLEEELVATMTINNMYPVVNNSHVRPTYNNAVLDIYINQDYDCTVATPIIKGFYSYDEPVNSIYYKRHTDTSWTLGQTFADPIVAGDWTIVPDEPSNAHREIKYQFKAVSDDVESYVATTEPIALDRKIPSLSFVPHHLTGAATSVGKYFTDWYYTKDDETSVISLNGNLIPSRSSVLPVSSYLSFYQTTNNYEAYSRSLFPGVESIKYKFTPSVTTSGYYQLWGESTDASTNTNATYLGVNIDVSFTDTSPPSLICWSVPSLINSYFSDTLDGILSGGLYDNGQINNAEYRTTLNGVYTDWTAWADTDLLYDTSNYKTASFSFMHSFSDTGVGAVNLKVYDTFLNTSTYIATYVVDKIVPSIIIYSLHGGFVNPRGKTSAEITNNGDPTIYVDCYDNYLIGTMNCAIDKGLYTPIKISEDIYASRIYQGWKSVEAMSVDTVHQFTFGAEDFAKNRATLSYYITLTELATYSATAMVLHRHEVMDI